MMKSGRASRCSPSLLRYWKVTESFNLGSATNFLNSRLWARLPISLPTGLSIQKIYEDILQLQSKSLIYVRFCFSLNKQNKKLTFYIPGTQFLLHNKGNVNILSQKSRTPFLFIYNIYPKSKKIYTISILRSITWHEK